jgi:hypothetical protein
VDGLCLGNCIRCRCRDRSRGVPNGLQQDCTQNDLTCPRAKGNKMKKNPLRRISRILFKTLVR